MLYDTSWVSAFSPACKTIRCTVPEPGSSSVDGNVCGYMWGVKWGSSWQIAKSLGWNVRGYVPVDVVVYLIWLQRRKTIW